MSRGKNEAALRNAPLDGRTAPENGCVYSARDCVYTARKRSGSSGVPVILNGAGISAERGRTLRGVIGVGS